MYRSDLNIYTADEFEDRFDQFSRQKRQVVWHQRHCRCIYLLLSRAQAVGYDEKYSYVLHLGNVCINILYE